MVLFPHCKINLGLWVVERMPDGYHHIETCFYPVPWCDVLDIVPASSLSLHCTGIELSSEPSANLCLKAYDLLRQDFDLPPVAIHLHKTIPVGAGLGGGSSDAAYVIRSLDQQFGLGLSLEQRLSYAAQLGSDCSFFMYDTPMWGSGRGNRLRSINLSLQGKTVVLVYPSFSISSGEAYSLLTQFDGYDSSWMDGVYDRPLRWRDELKNTFEKTLYRTYPILAEVKEELYKAGAFYASLSGSGSTVFGLFDHAVDLVDHFPEMWCRSVRL